MGIDAKIFFTIPYKTTQTKANHIAFDLAEAIGSDKLMQSNWGEDWDGNKHLGLLLRDTYEQDGPPIHKPKHGSLVEVMLYGRYYGAGYERGPLFDYIQIAEWIEINISQSLVYYGGDSGGICAEPFNEEHRKELIHHWAMYGHLPYRTGYERFTRDPSKPNKPEPIKCGLSRCQLNQYGFGQNYMAYNCPGCSSQWETRNGGMTFTKLKKEWL